MFQVVIADDESSVIHSLMESVCWEELSLSVTAVASNGYEALELAAKNNIDIAILDIRMPGINGLELCEKLKNSIDQIQLIIISGYAEFAYAEKAIQYGVLGYCLKPLEYSQVIRLLRKAVVNLEQLRHISVKEDLLDLLESRDEKKIRSCLYNLGFEKGGCYVAASIGEKKLKYLEERGISLRLGRKRWGYLMKNKQETMPETEVRNLQDWQGIGFVPEKTEIGEIYDTLEECIARAFQYFVEEEHYICSALEEGRANKWLDAIKNEIRGNHSEHILEILEEISKKGVCDFTVRSSLRLCNLIFSLPLFQETENYIYSMEQLVAEYGTFNCMLETLSEDLKKAGERIDSEGKFTNTAFMKLIKYVNENYRNDISLSSAAQVLYMNPNYISQMFKKGTGITFVHYITQKRLEDAKELLITTQKPLTDIAIEVGFNDYFHFIKTFKRFAGMTPSQYRIQK